MHVEGSAPSLSEQPKPQEDEGIVPTAQSIDLEQRKFGITEVAESYGLAQAELETMLSTTDPNEYGLVAVEIIDRYPALTEYRKVFLAGMEGLGKARRTTDLLWDSVARTLPETQRWKDEARTKPSDDLSRAVFKKVLELKKDARDPQDPITAYKGAFTWIELSPRDAATFLGNGKDQGTTSGETWKLDMGDPLVAIVLADNGDVVATHEAQHGLSHIIKQGYIDELIKQGFSPDSPLLKVLSDKRNATIKGETPLEAQIKEEMEAYLTEAKMTDEWNLHDGLPPLGSEKLRQFFSTFSSGFFTEGKLYATSLASQQAHSLTPELLTAATEALITLREFQITTQEVPAHIADLASVKTLRLFPLEEWPLITRTILDKHAAQHNGQQ